MRKIYLYGVALIGALIILFQLAQVIYRLLLALMGDYTGSLFSTETAHQLADCLCRGDLGRTPAGDPQRRARGAGNTQASRSGACACAGSPGRGCDAGGTARLARTTANGTGTRAGADSARAGSDLTYDVDAPLINQESAVPARREYQEHSGWQGKCSTRDVTRGCRAGRQPLPRRHLLRNSPPLPRLGTLKNPRPIQQQTIKHQQP